MAVTVDIFATDSGMALGSVLVEDGTATVPVIARRIRVSDLTGRSLMVHAGGDNDSDMPVPLGGGGARVACGVILATGN